MTYAEDLACQRAATASEYYLVLALDVLAERTILDAFWQVDCRDGVRGVLVFSRNHLQAECLEAVACLR